ncbi:MAG: YncE family protein [candidate division WOR-3 bacterium]|nr:MAG: YncE family protein [candidate division WOR-3 bacterium]
MRFRFSPALAAALVVAAGTMVLTCRQMVLNLAPAVPAIPSGPSEGRTDTLYQFVSMTTDPDGDDIALRFDWGDGDTSDWTAFQTSGDSTRLWHMWLWAGDFQVRAQAKDRNGALSDWSGPGDVEVTNPYRYPITVTDSVLVEDWLIERMAASHDGNHVYCIDTEEDFVVVIDAAANVMDGVIELDAWTQDVCVSPDDEFLYVADGLYNTVVVVRLADRTVVAEIPVGYCPTGIGILPGGDFVYVGLEADSRVMVIRTSDNSVVDSVEVGYDPWEVEATPDGEYVCVLNYDSETISVIRTSDNTVVCEENARCCPWSMTVVGNDRLYVSSDEEGVIQAFALPDMEHIARVDVPAEYVTGIDATPDGRFVYFCEDGFGTVGVIDAGSNRLLGFVCVAEDAELASVVCMPDGERVYVAGYEEHIWMLGMEEGK